MLLYFRSFLFFITWILLLSSSVKSDDDADMKLFDAINKYRSTLRLPILAENKNAKCLADQIAEQLKDKSCSNSTGADTVPGTEDQFSNYPSLLEHCQLNITTTREGMVMPACVPRLEETLVITNFTKSQYNKYLNDSQFYGAGVSSENNWIVAVLTTNTTGGNYAPADNSAGMFLKAAGFQRSLAMYVFSFLMALMC